MKYYTLLTMHNGQWGVAFGDYDKDVVLDEKADCYAGEKTKLITTKADQAAVDKKIAELNAALGVAA